VGTMIEVPRGALRAGDLAKTAEFFSFGTNDLTQMVSSSLLVSCTRGGNCSS
jgi:phosphoenolpyruvate-protein kinase (PTS system EI component)